MSENLGNELIKAPQMSAKAILKSPKLIVAPSFMNLKAGDRIGKKLDGCGHVRSVSILGCAPYMRFAVEYSKICEAERAIKKFKGSEFSIIEPKLLESWQETVRLSNYKGTVPELYHFMLIELDYKGLKKIYESREEDDVIYMDLSETGSALRMSERLSNSSFPWSGVRFTVDRPFFPLNMIHVESFLTGSERRIKVTMLNIPRCYDSAYFKDKLSTRLRFIRSISLEEMIIDFDMPFDDKLEINRGFATIKFRTPNFLHSFYEEFQGYKFSTPNQSKRFRIQFAQ